MRCSRLHTKVETIMLPAACNSKIRYSTGIKSLSCLYIAQDAGTDIGTDYVLSYDCFLYMNL